MLGTGSTHTNPMPQLENKGTGFTRPEIRVFKIYALIVAAIAAGLFVVTPKGLGQVIAVLFSLILLAVPPFTIYLVRRRKALGKTHA